ncbi:MAG TPA: flagellar biosynthetic protein FliR [Polyangiaceae bacterium]
MPTVGELVAPFIALEVADLRAFALAWARALPIVTIVPVFGMPAVAAPIRLGFAAALALGAAPALRPLASDGTPFVLALLRESAAGLPVALGTAALLWATVMAGGLADNLRGTREALELPWLEEPASPLAGLFGLFVAVAFIEVGGAARVAAVLAEPELRTTWAAAAERLAASIGLAVAIAAPLVAGSLVVEIAGALIARSASPAFVLPLLAPLRSLALLAVVWVSFDRIAELVVILEAAG